MSTFLNTVDIASTYYQIVSVILIVKQQFKYYIFYRSM